MEREIKFRVWNGSQMIDDVTVGKHGAFWTSGISDIDAASLGNTTIYHETTPLMQFTGLRDKKGKEIYEGDIVDVWSAGSNLKNGIIKFGQGRAGFFIGNASNSTCWSLSGGGDNYNQEDLKVIGNIYENPELLKRNVLK